MSMWGVYGMVGEEIVLGHTSRVVYARLPDGSKAFIRYLVEGDRVRVLETYTPPKHRGKGVAKLMMDYLVRLVVEKGLYVEPVCSYAVYYFIKNPDKRDLLVPELRESDLEELFRERLAIERRGK